MNGPKNPVLLIVGLLGGLVDAAVAVLTSFGFNLTPGQTGAITGLVAVVVAIITAILAAMHVTPYDPSVGNTPQNMALLRVYESQQKVQEQAQALVAVKPPTTPGVPTGKVNPHQPSDLVHVEPADLPPGPDHWIADGPPVYKAPAAVKRSVSKAAAKKR